MYARVCVCSVSPHPPLPVNLLPVLRSVWYTRVRDFDTDRDSDVVSVGEGWSLRLESCYGLSL